MKVIVELETEEERALVHAQPDQHWMSGKASAVFIRTDAVPIRIEPVVLGAKPRYYSTVYIEIALEDLAFHSEDPHFSNEDVWNQKKTPFVVQVGAVEGLFPFKEEEHEGS